MVVLKIEITCLHSATAFRAHLLTLPPRTRPGRSFAHDLCAQCLEVIKGANGIHSFRNQQSVSPSIVLNLFAPILGQQPHQYAFEKTTRGLRAYSTRPRLGRARGSNAEFSICRSNLVQHD